MFALFISGCIEQTSTQQLQPAYNPITNQHYLTWTAPVEREDGTPISMAEIGGYNIYYGPNSGDYIDSTNIPDSYVDTYFLTGWKGALHIL